MRTKALQKQWLCPSFKVRNPPAQVLQFLRVKNNKVFDAATAARVPISCSRKVRLFFSAGLFLFYFLLQVSSTLVRCCFLPLMETTQPQWKPWCRIESSSHCIGFVLCLAYFSYFFKATPHLPLQWKVQLAAPVAFKQHRDKYKIWIAIFWDIVQVFLSQMGNLVIFRDHLALTFSKEKCCITYPKIIAFEDQNRLAHDQFPDFLGYVSLLLFSSTALYERRYVVSGRCSVIPFIIIYTKTCRLPCKQKS